MSTEEPNRSIEKSSPSASAEGESGQQVHLTLNRSLATFGLVAAIILTGVIGYLIIDTVTSAMRPVTSLPNAVGTQVSEIVNPTPTIIADPVTVVRQVRDLARLETSAYTIEKVITAEQGEGAFSFLTGDRILLVAQGEVIAGVDLSRMQEGDVQVVDERVFITLPAAEIFVATLDNDETYVYDRSTGLLGPETDLETLARQAAEDEILAAAIEDGILRQAQGNAELVIESLILGLGFEEVTFVTATPAPDQDRGE